MKEEKENNHEQTDYNQQYTDEMANEYYCVSCMALTKFDCCCCEIDE